MTRKNNNYSRNTHKTRLKVPDTFVCLILKNNATKREVLHEIGHALTHRHLGDAAYEKLSKSIREHLASTFVRSRDAFKKMTPEEVWQELKSIDPNFVPDEAIKALLKKWGVIS